MVWELLRGKKTYLVALFMVFFAVVGYAAGWVTPEKALEIFMEAAAVAGLRHAVSNG